MGMQDRDWYRDWLRERDRYEERATFRLPAKRVTRSSKIPWVRPSVMFALGLALLVWALFRVIRPH